MKFIYNNSAHFTTEMLLFMTHCRYNLRDIRIQENVSKLQDAKEIMIKLYTV